MDLYRCARPTECIAVIAQRRSTSIRRAVEDVVEPPGERRPLAPLDRGAGPERVDACREEALIGIDVADPRHDRLVEESRLDRPAAAGQRGREMVGERGRFGQERIRSERGPRGPERALVDMRREPAEPPWIPKHHPPL